MTMAAAIENGTADLQTWSKPGRIASIDIVRDLEGCEATWRAMENAGQSCTPYQRFDFVSAWQRNVATISAHPRESFVRRPRRAMH